MDWRISHAQAKYATRHFCITQLRNGGTQARARSQHPRILSLNCAQPARAEDLVHGPPGAEGGRSSHAESHRRFAHPPRKEGPNGADSPHACTAAAPSSHKNRRRIARVPQPQLPSPRSTFKLQAFKLSRSHISAHCVRVDPRTHARTPGSTKCRCSPYPILCTLYLARACAATARNLAPAGSRFLRFAFAWDSQQLGV